MHKYELHCPSQVDRILAQSLQVSLIKCRKIRSSIGGDQIPGIRISCRLSASGFSCEASWLDSYPWSPLHYGLSPTSEGIVRIQREKNFALPSGRKNQDKGLSPQAWSTKTAAECWIGVTGEGNAKRAVSHPHVWTDVTEAGGKM